MGTIGLLPELDKVSTLPKLESILPHTQISELHVPCAGLSINGYLILLNIVDT